MADTRATRLILEVLADGAGVAFSGVAESVSSASGEMETDVRFSGVAESKSNAEGSLIVYIPVVASAFEMKKAMMVLLPPGAIWRPREAGDFDNLLTGIGLNLQKVFEFCAALAYIRDPRRTTILEDLEKEYGIIAPAGQSEATRRTILAVTKYVKPSTASYSHVQDRLRELGFTGIMVIPNDPAVDPATFGDDLVINGPLYEDQGSAILMQCAGEFAYCGNGKAVLGYFINAELDPYEYTVPTMWRFWRFIFTVSGSSGLWPELSREALIRNILKFKPLRSWGILAEAGAAWALQNPPDGLRFTDICYGNGIFVAVGNSGTGQRVATSADGENWDLQDTPADLNYTSVCWAPGPGLFVAVASTGTGQRVITSADGENWDLQDTPVTDLDWTSVCWAPGPGLFVAVANTGTGQRVMSSPDGENWTLQTTPANLDFMSVCWGDGPDLFVAVANSGTGQRVITSPDGITWTLRGTPSPDVDWFDVIYGEAAGLFVAVGANHGGKGSMSSPDGINWTARDTPPGTIDWYGIAHGNGWFVAVGNEVDPSGFLHRSIRSSDGINWENSYTPSLEKLWFKVAHGNGLFVAVALEETGQRVMISGDGI